MITLFLYFTAVVIYKFSLFGITAGVHRLWSHRAYKARFPLRVFLAMCNSMSYQNSVYEWARDHRWGIVNTIYFKTRLNSIFYLEYTISTRKLMQTLLTLSVASSFPMWDGFFVKNTQTFKRLGAKYVKKISASFVKWQLMRVNNVLWIDRSTCPTFWQILSFITRESITCHQWLPYALWCQP